MPPVHRPFQSKKGKTKRDKPHASENRSNIANNNAASADGPFSIPSPGSPQSSPAQLQSQSSAKLAAAADKEASGNIKARNDNPRTSSSGFDPEALERGAIALREISSNSNAKKLQQLPVVSTTAGSPLQLASTSSSMFQQLP
ncbi:hypothetical protein F3Y22_tig00110372pilonHSYRG00181 [Hibiscus syriacus]|uniref:ATPase family AAA domain-containing protein n=1 Tax=Hibiscus syriacus TaxID=106335 RepID=A0A6A3AT48_HIBSY|nr:hypothetical protein F3Y22_tig00110372pilonHSYRG00181 [Hibiscus syriacus]